jgi:hypothetical protein
MFRLLCIIDGVRDDPKLPSDMEKSPFLNGVVGGSIPVMESSLYLTGKTS